MYSIQAYPNHTIDIDKRLVYRIKTPVLPDSKGKYHIRFRGSVIKLTFFQLRTLVRPELTADVIIKSDTMKKDIRELKEEKLTVGEIAYELGISPRVVSKYVTEIFLEDHPENVNSSEPIYSLRKRETHKKIKEMITNGCNIQDIADALKITTRTVYNNM
jgi:DNA-binding CsgD family transcriptional regulator